MPFPTWYLIAGLLLISMALAGTRLARLPLTTSLVYLLIGLALGPHFVNLISLDPIDHAPLIERASEFAVIVSLFTAGLKLRLPLSDPRWFLPLRLASLSMTLTVALIALAGVYLLHLPWGAAILLGAILAPTDPVLASDVQVEHPSDRDRLRFSLTGEAGLNDGIAFPFVMLGLGLLHLHDLGSPFLWKWLAVDVLWSITGGLAVGALAGTLIAQLVLHLRRTHKEAVGLDEFLALGLLALAYGAALLIHTYGFLAAFAAGVALRRVEAAENSTPADTPDDVEAAADASATPTDPKPPTDPNHPATHPEKAPAYMARAVLGFNQQLERIAEVAIVLLIGGLITTSHLPTSALWFVPLLFFVIRPLSTYLGLFRTRATSPQRALIAWFGVRGVGSLYHLAFAITHGLPPDLAHPLTSLTLTTVAASILLHGISVTPLMTWYESRRSPPAHQKTVET